MNIPVYSQHAGQLLHVASVTQRTAAVCFDYCSLPSLPPCFSITALARALPFPPCVKSMSTEAVSRGPPFPFAFAAAPVKPPPLALLTADGRITHHHHHHVGSTHPLAQKPSRTWHWLPSNPLPQRKHYAKKH